MSYYKFTTPDALAAWDAMEKKEAEVRQHGKEFAALFGGNPVFRNDLTRASFYGVRFESNPYISAELWTKPNGNNGYSSTPKVKAPKGMGKEAKALAAKWKENYPTLKLDREPMLDALGLDWGMLFITGCHYFRHGDAIYVETGARPKTSAGAIEIIGSEFNEAKSAAKA
ncbi:hypothetical protein ACP3TC_04820 [Winslowiella sp. 2C04]|uniref:hypothetical protein n=1 Tax=Winslowiella sp. 2C04 TaxID=3416179 RepID=UPI003CF0DFC3